jgi:DNA-binding response OmpR family regulator
VKTPVLIVDDSLTVRMDLAEAFEHAGFTPILCASLAEARRVLAESTPGVVVLDVVLPDGDGVALLRELRARDTHTVVLMLSTEAEVADRVRALKTGADDYVGKPYDRSYVVAKARELMRARQGAPGGRVRVLVIDDSPTFREALRAALERAGYETLVAESGEDGLRVAADRRPSAIVVDGVLPGIDGAAVIRHLRLDAALRGTPCVLLTASEDRDAELRALDAGADAFVRKTDDFELILARLGAVLRSTTATRDDTVASLGARKILAIDDSSTFLHELAGALRGEGYDVVLARSGEEGIEVLAVETVDCILLDLVMPGIGGHETCRRIKAAPVVRDIPLVMLTAREDRAAMLEGLAAGADDFIPKSSDFAVLKARVRAQIRRKQLEDENRLIREQLLRAAHAEALEEKNRELEAFSYSVSHDLRAPLRAIDGFSAALAEDYGPQLDDVAREYIGRIQTSVRRMAALIEDLLRLARVSRVELAIERCDLGAIARDVLAQITARDPSRGIEVEIADGLEAEADPGLLRTVFENLLGNAWKFTASASPPRITVGAVDRSGRRAFFVRDNGIGFDAAHADKLFRPFYRLHSDAEFEGTGVGLSTVHRIIARHGGQVWAEGAVGAGATIYFTLGEP